MEDTEMDQGGGDESVRPKAEALSAALNSLAAAASKLSALSRGIPSNSDFHFYNNFPDFKSPARDITSITAPSINTISSSLRSNGNATCPTNDLDDALDWVVNLNDELLERFGASLDEFKLPRTKEEQNETKTGIEENGFQLVVGKNKKNKTKEESAPASSYSATGVSVATKDKRANKTKVPFHIPSIRRPQDEYRILVNNTNVSFQHVWLEKSEDGDHFIHPLEKLSVMDFVDNTISDTIKPPPFENTPFKLVEELNDLKNMVAKLKAVSEFAVDLEHNQYRSFQGLTCLMQISTRTEDYIVDTLKLRIYIGSYLRDIFKDPSKKKVMHGSDHDILWLQRDFGIYVCNLFDTGQASRVLQLERNSLEFLLNYFCEVNANKEYQNADWRLRPLPAEMVKYAREDTHYLLYIYDLMRNRLISESTDDKDLLLEVYERSNEICLKMYEKELLTDTSFLNIYGVQQAELNARQLAIVSGLYQWRDYVARAEDESTGYILPNKTLIEIAKEMPLTSDKLLTMLTKSRHSYVERNIGSVLDIIRNSFSQSHAFESIATQLKQTQLEKLKAKEAEMNQVSSELKATAPAYTPSQPLIAKAKAPLLIPSQPADLAVLAKAKAKAKEAENLSATSPSFTPGKSVAHQNVPGPKPKTAASVQVMKKPAAAAAFGALFAKPSSFAKKPLIQKQEDNKNKLDKIKQTVTLPFNFPAAFRSNNNDIIMMQSSPALYSQPQNMQIDKPPIIINNNNNNKITIENMQVEKPPITTTNNKTTMEDIIPLEVNKEEDDDGIKHEEWFPNTDAGKTVDSDSDSDSDNNNNIPTELSSSFEKCFKSISEMRNSQNNQQNKKTFVQNTAPVDLKPFDYTAARKNFQSNNNNDNSDEEGDNNNNNNYDNTNKNNKNNRNRESKARRANLKKEKGEKGENRERGPRRSQAFPMSGNRSTTYT